MLMSVCAHVCLNRSNSVAGLKIIIKARMGSDSNFSLSNILKIVSDKHKSMQNTMV